MRAVLQRTQCLITDRLRGHEPKDNRRVGSKKAIGRDTHGVHGEDGLASAGGNAKANVGQPWHIRRRLKGRLVTA